MITLVFLLYRLDFFVGSVRYPECLEASPVANDAHYVLLVDDDPAVRRMIKTYLERRGVVVVDAPSANEAWRILSGKSSSVQLLITDQMMPGISGEELIRNVRAAGFEFPIILMSGYSDESRELCDGVDCLRKPLDFKVLASRVSELIGMAAAPVPRLCRAS